MHDNDDELDQTIKIVLLGDGATGKTSIAQRFSQDGWPQSNNWLLTTLQLSVNLVELISSYYKQTIGLDFYQKRITLAGNTPVVIQIWDVGGQTLTSKMTQNYLYGANAIILVYDITNIGTFQNLEEWMKLIQQAFLQGYDSIMVDAKDSRLPYMALMGNKSDLSHIRVVKPDRHQQLASDYNLVGFFVSARTGEGISNAIYHIAADLLGVSSKRITSMDGITV
ncbi:Ras- protein Rab-28 [Dinochytrium kinnereticum]|nr:Ras- protein Rab-28 [Dinochytrium kinnereticum]